MLLERASFLHPATKHLRAGSVAVAVDAGVAGVADAVGADAAADAAGSIAAWTLVLSDESDARFRPAGFSLDFVADFGVLSAFSNESRVLSLALLAYARETRHTTINQF